MAASSTDIDTELKHKVLESMQFINSELTDKYTAGKAFVVEQAPLVVQEMIRWAIFDHCFFAVIDFSIIVLWFLGIRYILKNEKRIDENYLEESVVKGWFICGGIVSFWCVVHEFFQIWHLAQAIIAPRLFLIEQAKDLLK